MFSSGWGCISSLWTSVLLCQLCASFKGNINEQKSQSYGKRLFTFFRIVLFADEIFRELYERFCHENLQICENVLDTFVIQPENLVLIKCLYNNSLKHPLLAAMIPTIYRSQHLFFHSSASAPSLVPLFSFPSVRLSLP